MPEVAAAPAVYGFRLEFFGEDHAPVHDLALAAADFGRAVETTFFDGLRRGVFPAYEFSPDRARIEPAFEETETGSPRATGFFVTLATPQGDEHRLEFDSDFFASRATRVGAELVRDKKLSEEAKLLFQLAAYLDTPAETKPRRPGRILLEEATVRVPIRPGSRKALGPAEAWDNPNPDEVPVLIPRHVLQECVEEARRFPDREIGGVLLGHLRRDADGSLYLEITCQVPAEETESTSTSVTFTGATWQRVREVIDLRGEGEIFAGWVHSHPFRFCKDCPLPTPAECVGKVLFYSADDEFLMELSFAQPFMVGLLTAVEPKLEASVGHLPVRLYGWRHGQVKPRGFEVIDVS